MSGHCLHTRMICSWTCLDSFIAQLYKFLAVVFSFKQITVVPRISCKYISTSNSLAMVVTAGSNNNNCPRQ